MLLLFILFFFSDDTQKLRFKDLRKEVTAKLARRLHGDTDATRRIRLSFGIHDFSRFARPDFNDDLNLFNDTPVKLLKDVFEALKLYDLVDLLEQSVRSHTTMSLRQALTLDEIRKLRNTSNRPTTFHSCAAVLIFAQNKDDHGVNKVKSFFKGLNSNSDVTIIQHTIDEELERMKRNVEGLEKTIQLRVMARWISSQGWYELKNIVSHFNKDLLY